MITLIVFLVCAALAVFAFYMQRKSNLKKMTELTESFSRQKASLEQESKAKEDEVNKLLVQKADLDKKFQEKSEAYDSLEKEHSKLKESAGTLANSYNVLSNTLNSLRDNILAISFDVEKNSEKKSFINVMMKQGSVLVDTKRVVFRNCEDGVKRGFVFLLSPESLDESMFTPDEEEGQTKIEVVE